MPSADAVRGTRATAVASAVAATSITRRRTRRRGNSVRNAYSTRRNKTRPSDERRWPEFTLPGDGKRAMSKRWIEERKMRLLPLPLAFLAYLAPLAGRGWIRAL